MANLTLSSTAATLSVTGAAPSIAFAVSSTPAVFAVVPVQPEPFIGGDTDAGGGAGLNLSLSLSL